LQAPATKLKLHNINHLKLLAEVLQIHEWLPLRSHQQTAAFHAVLLRSTGTAADPHRWRRPSTGVGTADVRGPASVLQGRGSMCGYNEMTARCPRQASV
jgi:hypothetical protein